jgi:hypothetical protein
MGRRTLTTLLSLLLVVFSLITTFCSKYLTERNGSNRANNALCSDVFTSGDEEQQRAYAEQVRSLSRLFVLL